MTPSEQQQLFLSDLRTGPGFIGWLAPGGTFKQQAFATDQQASSLIGSYSGSANVWVSMATFGLGACRAAQNAEYLKSFWLDVDAHGKGPYGTPDEALAGIKTFVADAGLPTPNFVHMTGHGMQAFWVLPSPISKPDWQPVADDLQELAKRMNLGADPITADAARILRVPGTYNFRDPDNPVATSLSKVKAGYTDLHAFHAAIKAALSKLPSPATKPTKTLPAGIPDTPANSALVKAMLSAIDPDCDYDPWRNICWAVAASGLSDAETITRDWSATADRWDKVPFDEVAFDRVWDSYDPDREKAVGFGTLVHHARQAGYTGDIPRALEQLEKLEFKNDASATVTITPKGLMTQRASEIEPEPVEWLIEGAIPMGMLVVIGGQPGMGKSQIAIKLAAAVTTGEGLPDV
ncbi:AAA family ATPase [Novosphingobium sp.]|jgi:hypothetical protein|uniref:AAA family ATPase n=1 Tax=Novosphingobium sp. TaxID=1874826 RepID=UPI0022CCE887|nr:AAA family ATPase [Novosphingobium sp.]MCZ8018846.1 AAA family ATPase [Novosphingobium sp.]MCZ8034452.1 AAA family ATPase [Novosphingobium sp.]MCZ8052000.1 AAA family ATPase [Novosphingobium sp.]MCZ8059927.1 AAA family ATPase [Novosphingobium sp.]MCZ8230888.1 AAA family ATPase [Novosphingobium sp.]